MTTDTPDTPTTPVVTNGLNREQMHILMRPLDPERVRTRRQAGRELSYVEAYDVKATLIRVFGFGGFDSEVTNTQILATERDIPKRDNGTTPFRVTAMCTVRLRIHSLNATYTETAVASQAGSDPGEVTDFAVKTASSDALKRCAIFLGDQFGLSLYNDGSTDQIVTTIAAPDQADLVPEKITPEQIAAIGEWRDRFNIPQVLAVALPRADASASNMTREEGDQVLAWLRAHENDATP